MYYILKRKCSIQFQIDSEGCIYPSDHQNKAWYLCSLLAEILAFTTGASTYSKYSSTVGKTEDKILLNDWMKALESWRLVAKESLYILKCHLCLGFALESLSFFSARLAHPHTSPLLLLIASYQEPTSFSTLFMGKDNFTRLFFFFFFYTFASKTSMYLVKFSWVFMVH
jgi:hypothetical protein